MDASVYEMERPLGDFSEALEAGEDRKEGQGRVNAAVKAFAFIMKQSYICALIAMMVRHHTHYTSPYTTVQCSTTHYAKQWGIVGYKDVKHYGVLENCWIQFRTNQFYVRTDSTLKC